MIAQRPERAHHYHNLFMDSQRWDGFAARDGDIIVCTPYKSGTTWVQMICALLVFRTTQLPRPLAEISPWLDLRVAPIANVLASYAAQSHRRIIKTHTALDGLPYFDNVTYLYCARDPREIFISMWNHGKNQWMADHFVGAAFDVVDVLGEIAEQLGCTIGQVALAWCMRQPGVTSAIIGPRTVEQCVDNLQAVMITPEPEQMKNLDRIAPPGRMIVPYYQSGTWGAHQQR
jgi:hypothetical protein